jgi:polyhydroxyalkanoate synthesis regulator phasin
MELNPEAKEFVPEFTKELKENIMNINKDIIKYIDDIVDDKEWNKKNYKIEIEE